MKQPTFDSPPPCVQAPRLWDAPTQHEARTGRYQQRHGQAIDMCLTQCPSVSFEQCRIFALTEGLADDSILAGMTGKERENLTGRKRARHGKQVDRFSDGCTRGHSPEKRYMSSTGRLRCKQCNNDYDSEKIQAQRAERGCRNGHRPDEYYSRPSGELVCRACELAANARRNVKRRVDRAEHGCRNGHKPDEYYIRPSGAFVCRACELRRNSERNVQRRVRKMPTRTGKLVVA